MFLLLAVAAIALTAALTEHHPTLQVVGFSIFGAILQSAFLGIVYEIYLRDQVENSTLNRLKLSRDVAESGLRSISAGSNLDWTQILLDTTTVCIVSGDPGRVLGLGLGAALDRASLGHLRELRIAIPEAQWDSSSDWVDEVEQSWASQAPDAELFVSKVGSSIAFDLVANDSAVYVLLPTTVHTPRAAESKLFAFDRKSKPGSVGHWLNVQVHAVVQLVPHRGRGVDQQALVPPMEPVIETPETLA